MPYVWQNGTMADEKGCLSDREADLLDRLRGGDGTAMAEIHKLYFDRLYSLVFNQVGRDRDRAEDIVQETFLAALKSPKGSKGWSSIYAWLCSMACQKVADLHRRKSRDRRRASSDVDSDEAVHAEYSGRQPQPESSVGSAQAQQTVSTALEKLPWYYRQVLILRYVEDMSVQEISQIVGRSPKAIDELLRLSREALEANLTKDRDV